MTTTTMPPAANSRRSPRRRVFTTAVVVVVVAAAATLVLTRPWARTEAPIALTAPYCGALSQGVITAAFGEGPVLPPQWDGDQPQDLPGSGRCTIHTEVLPTDRRPYTYEQRVLSVREGLAGPLGWAWIDDVLGSAQTETAPGPPDASMLVIRTGDRSAEGRLRRADSTNLTAVLDNGVAADPVAALTDVLLAADAALSQNSAASKDSGPPAPRTPVDPGVRRSIEDGPVCGVWARDTLAAGGVSIAASTEPGSPDPVDTLTVQRTGWRTCYVYPHLENGRLGMYTAITTGVLDPADAARMPGVVSAAVAQGATAVAGGLGYANITAGSARVRVVVGDVLVSLDAGVDTTVDDPAFERVIDEAVAAARTFASSG